MATFAIQRVLKRHVRDFAGLIRDTYTPGRASEILQEPVSIVLATVKQRPALNAAVRAYTVAGSLMGSKACLYALGDAAKVARAPVGVAFEADELVERQLDAKVAEWVANTSVIETATTSKQLEEIYHRAVGPQSKQDSLTQKGIADQILEEGLADTGGRARMLSRTLVHWAYGEGAIEAYDDAGLYESEWLATMDDVVREWHASLSGTRVPIGTPFVSQGETFTDSRGMVHVAKFDVYHQPLEPNCRCTVVPVISEIG